MLETKEGRRTIAGLRRELKEGIELTADALEIQKLAHQQYYLKGRLAVYEELGKRYGLDMERKVCACGCGRKFMDFTLRREYFNDACRSRAYRKRQIGGN